MVRALSAVFAALFALAAAAPSSRAADAKPGAPAVLQRDIRELVPLAVLHVGKTADWVALDAHAVWVGSTGPNAVHRLDPDGNSHVARVLLPGEPCAGIALGFGSVWVPLCGPHGGLARIDATGNRLLTRYPVGKIEAECGITTGPDAVWLASQDVLLRVDPHDGAIRQRIALPQGSCNPHYADGIVWVTRAAGAELTAVEAASGKIVATTKVNPHPRFLTVGAQSVWTLNQGDGSLSQVRMRTYAIAHTTPLGTPGHGGDIAYGQGFIWTTMPKVPLSVIDAATAQLRCQWRGPGGDSLGVADGAIWLTDYRGGTVARIALQQALQQCGLTN